MLLVPVIAILGYFTVGTVLSFPAELPRRADAIVVLGGGDGARYTRGRDLLLSGYSERLLLINPSDSEREDAAGRFSSAKLSVDDQPRNTWQEAKAVRVRMASESWHSVLVVSDPPHLLRVHYAWYSIFHKTELTYCLIASDPAWWSAWTWWRDPISKAFVSSEVLKLGYYIVRYRFDL